MSEKKKKHNAKLPQKLQPPNPKSGFFVPNSGFLCVFQTSYVQSFKKICVKIWITPC